MSELPPLLDLQVLSPLAWVKREKDRIGAVPAVKSWIARDYLDTLKSGAAYAGEIMCGEVEHGEGAEGDRRRLEFTLICLAAHATLWLDKIRENPLPVKEITK